MRTLEGPEDVEWLDWHSKGEPVRAWRVPGAVAELGGGLLAGCMHAGNILLAGSKDGTIWMWLASTGDCIKVRHWQATTGLLPGPSLTAVLASSSSWSCGGVRCSRATRER